MSADKSLKDKPPKDHLNQMLVEGNNDVHAIGALLAEHDIKWSKTKWMPYIKDMGSDEELVQGIPVAVNASYKRLAFVIDADISCSNRWSQIKKKLESEGIQVSSSPDPNGTVIERIVGKKTNESVYGLCRTTQRWGCWNHFCRCL